MGVGGDALVVQLEEKNRERYLSKSRENERKKVEVLEMFQIF